ncbi:MAG: SpaA isopeptide-forming pilin-related protein, partial [Acidimicrobiia bacterium]|nr:SpaA isopeptide-forming pilin-related protein [Acidimicrobiia bacterium]
TITETHPDAYLDGIDTAGTSGGDTSVNDQISGVVIDPGVESSGNSFAELGNIISGTVWIDTDEDGVPDPEETNRLEGVVIELYDDQGTLVNTVTTDEFGNYAFPSVPPGDYTVVQVQPEAYGTTTPTSVDVVLPLGGLSDVNFGQDPATIVGVVWEDLNGDGTRNPGEPGVGDVTVNLLDPDGNVVATTTTNPDGGYEFLDLPAGDYTVELVTPDGMVVTSPESGTGDTIGSDFPYIVTVVRVSVAAGEDVRDIDGGIVEEKKDLSVDIGADVTTATVGDTAVYTVRGTNLGNAPIIGGIQVVVTVPGSSIESVESEDLCGSGGGLVLNGIIGGALTFPGCWDVVVDGQTITAIWTGDLLPGEETPPFTIITEVEDTGDLVVTATISTVDGSPETTYDNNSDQVLISVLTSTAPPALALTGSNAGRAVGLGLLLVLLGGVVMAIDRRRRREPSV